MDNANKRGRENTISCSTYLFLMIRHQGSQNNSHFEISSDCVVFGSRLHIVKSAVNDNTIGANLKMGVVLRALLMMKYPTSMLVGFLR